MSNSVTPWSAARQDSLSITNSQSLLKLMSIELVMPSNHLFFCSSLLLPPLLFPSVRVSSSESAYIRWPKYWSFSLSISPSNEYWGLISFRIDRYDLLAVQGTLSMGQMYDFTIFSPILHIVFSLFSTVFWSTNAFNFHEVHFNYYFFFPLCFAVVSKNSLPN